MPNGEPERGRIDRTLATAGGATAWGAIGSIAGALVALLIPDTVASDPAIAAGGATLFGALHVLGVLRRLRPAPFERLQKALQHADRLFSAGIIDEAEYAAIRRRDLEEFGPQ
ncbi:MAG: hypothetical protein QGM45_12115 [Anaerolineales bacterium]|nr:hypothetical protein [Anaerolineales bacterium]